MGGVGREANWQCGEKRSICQGEGTRVRMLPAAYDYGAVCKSSVGTGIGGLCVFPGVRAPFVLHAAGGRWGARA
eukprot:275900-Prymnesium_polylepis.1